MVGVFMNANVHILSGYARSWSAPFAPVSNLTKSLAPKDYYQDNHSCALDAFNLAVGTVYPRLQP